MWLNSSQRFWVWAVFSLSSKARVASVREVLKNKPAYCTFCLKTHEKGILSHYVTGCSLIWLHISLKSPCGLPGERTLPLFVRKTGWMKLRSIPATAVFPRATVPNLFGTRDRFHGRQFFHRWPRRGLWGGWWVGGQGGCVEMVQVVNASDEERQMKLSSLARPLLTSCCADRFLTGRGPVVVRGPGFGDPCLEHNPFQRSRTPWSSPGSWSWPRLNLPRASYLELGRHWG